jgi:glycosyltransferase involved in cell wall biosynthesis
VVSLPNGSKDFYKEGIIKENIIYSCGRLLKRKGFQYLVEAFNNIAVSDWKLVIIGDGPYRSELERIAKGNKNIIFTGWLNHKDKEFIDIINKAKIFALLSKAESQGIVYLEAMSAKCAIIASNITACAETVSEDVGYLVERENVKEISEVFRDVMSDDHKLESFMENSRKRYERFYKWENIVKKYVKLYEE